MKSSAKAAHRLSTRAHDERAALLSECLDGQTLSRRERRRIAAMPLPQLREFASDVRALGAIQDEGRSAAEQEAAILARIEGRRCVPAKG